MKRWLKRPLWWGEFGALYLLFLISRLLPGRLRRGWGRLLGHFAHGVLRIRRKVVVDNLRAAFGAEWDEREIQAVARRFYVNLGVTLMEFFSLHDMSREQILAKVDIQGREHLDACLARGKGALLTSGHFGNWELLGAALSALGYPICYLIKSQANPYVDRMQNEIRRRAGIGIIRQGASARQLVYALRRRELVGILADQDGGNQGLFLDFLGRPASVFRGPAVFAYRTGCPIVPTCIVRQGEDRHRIEITEPIPADQGGDEETAVQRLSEAYTARLATAIRRHPEQYFWVHRRWKTRPPASGG